MSDNAYFAAVPLDHDGNGGVIAGRPHEARSEIAAKCMAAAMAATKAGAVAIARPGDPSACELGELVILGSYGQVAEQLRTLEEAA
jgi:hypothetical protein